MADLGKRPYSSSGLLRPLRFTVDSALYYAFRLVELAAVSIFIWFVLAHIGEETSRSLILWTVGLLVSFLACTTATTGLCKAAMMTAEKAGEAGGYVDMILRKRGPRKGSYVRISSAEREWILWNWVCATAQWFDLTWKTHQQTCPPCIAAVAIPDLQARADHIRTTLKSLCPLGHLGLTHRGLYEDLLLTLPMGSTLSRRTQKRIIKAKLGLLAEITRKRGSGENKKDEKDHEGA